MAAPKSINPNALKVRDPLMVRIICGATKAGPATDRKKAQNRKACRKPARKEDLS